MKKEEKFPYRPDPSAHGFSGPPEDLFSLINQFGTYEIQPTAESGGDFPMIAQGLPKALKHRRMSKAEWERSGRKDRTP